MVNNNGSKDVAAEKEESLQGDNAGGNCTEGSNGAGELCGLPSSTDQAESGIEQPVSAGTEVDVTTIGDGSLTEQVDEPIDAGLIIDFVRLDKLIPKDGKVILQVSKDADKLLVLFAPKYPNKLEETEQVLRPVNLKGTPPELNENFSTAILSLAKECNNFVSLLARKKEVEQKSTQIQKSIQKTTAAKPADAKPATSTTATTATEKQPDDNGSGKPSSPSAKKTVPTSAAKKGRPTVKTAAKSADKAGTENSAAACNEGSGGTSGSEQGLVKDNQASGTESQEKVEDKIVVAKAAGDNSSTAASDSAEKKTTTTGTPAPEKAGETLSLFGMQSTVQSPAAKEKTDRGLMKEVA